VEFWEADVDGELQPPPGQEPAGAVAQPPGPFDAIVTVGTGGRASLRHTLRSIHLFAPWVRRIHVVGADPAPAWLDASHPTVALGAAPDPAEGLLALDDHTFLGRPIEAGQWFARGPDARPVEVDVSLADVQRRLADLLQREHDCFRLVDLDFPARPPEVVDALVRDFLDGYFPVPAPWE
jgi:hypothetical protein